MSRTMRRRLLQTVELMGQAIQAADGMLQNLQYEESLTLLSDCQELAVALGTKIEQIRGMGTETVAALEQFCEVLYQAGSEISDAIDDGEDAGDSENGICPTNTPESVNAKNDQQVTEPVEFTERLRILRRQWEAVKVAFDRDVPDKKEVVFLPYKASMWDSLESVYLAAKEDLECEAYCVPIPYYDKDSDGSFGEMHYEGDEFPKNIEVTDWQQYDLEERLPDEIYIHNPYDEFNLVTSVHPGFYAKNLKQYTEELVYIPYFVLEEIEPDNQATIDKMKHFVWIPGVIYADKVIVQSEKMKQIYVNEYLKAAKENGMTGIHQDRGYLEKKILGSGSPKFDKVLATKKENSDIPEEWLRMIQKPDGSWKKIVFYNTAISGLLTYNEKWLDKIEDSLKTFKENQNDVTLLWRPHPLIENTMKSMRPDILQRYRNIIEQYQQESWGIYDDTADMDRAVALSDEYYGDGSSVVQLYQRIRKPVLIQNPDISRNSIIDSFKDVIIRNYLILGNKFICTSADLRGVLVGNYDGGCLELVADVKCSLLAGYAVAEYGGKVYFSPTVNNHIEIFDPETLTIECINLPRNEYGGIYNKFYSSISYDGKIYMFPGKYPYIVEYDIKNNEINRFELDNSLISIGENIFAETVCIDNNSVYLACWEQRCVFVFDLDNQMTRYIFPQPTMSQGGYRSICLGENSLYVSDEEGNIICLSKEENIRTEKIIARESNAEFRKCINWDGQIIFFDNNSYTGIMIDDKSREIKRFSMYVDSDKPIEYGIPHIVNGTLEIFDCNQKKYIYLDRKLNVVHEKTFFVKDVKFENEDINLLNNVLDNYLFLAERFYYELDNQ